MLKLSYSKGPSNRFIYILTNAMILCGAQFAAGAVSSLLDACLSGKELHVQNRSEHFRIIIAMVVILVGSGLFYNRAATASGAEKTMAGWEKGGAYDRFYNVKELEKFRATVVGLKEVIPMDGMSPGVALEVKESLEDEERIIVHVCPSNYMNMKDIGIKPGDRLKIRGAWAEINGQDIFMASKIKRGDLFELKVRLTKDGTPFWSMSEEDRKNASE